MAVNPVDVMTWKARELKISYGILLTQITEEERQEILEEYEEMLQKKEAEHQERLRQKALLPKPPQKRPQMKSLFYKDPEESLRPHRGLAQPSVTGREVSVCLRGRYLSAPQLGRRV